MKSAYCSLFLLALAASPIFSQQEQPTSPLMQTLSAAQAGTPQGSSAAELRNRDEVLALLPSSLDFAISLRFTGDIALVTQPVESFALGGSTDTISNCLDLFELARICAARVKASDPSCREQASSPEEIATLDEQLKTADAALKERMDTAQPIRFSPIYIALALSPELDEHSVRAFQQQFLEQQLLPFASQPVEYKGWQGASVTPSWFFSLGDQPSLIRSYFGDSQLHVLSRCDGHMMRICICQEPQQMSWPDSLEQSIVSLPDLADILPQGSEKAIFSLSAKQEALSICTEKLAALCDTMARLNQDPPEINAELHALRLISHEDLNIGVVERDLVYRARASFGLHGLSFLPGQLSLPAAAQEPHTFIFAASTPMRIDAGWAGNRDAAGISFSNGFSLMGISRPDGSAESIALRVPSLHVSDAARIISKLHGQEITLSQDVFSNLFPQLRLSGGMQGSDFVVSSADGTALKALSSESSGIGDFRGMVFSLRPETLYNMFLELPYSSFLLFIQALRDDVESMSGTLSEQDGKFCLHLHVQAIDWSEAYEEFERSLSETTDDEEEDTADNGEGEGIEVDDTKQDELPEGETGAQEE